MPAFDYKCDQCNWVELDVHMNADEYSDTLDVTDHAANCEGTLGRIWSAPRINAVKGAGGSPAR